VWQILAGQNEFTVSIIEADDDLDTGAIVAQARFALEGHELYNEINDKLFATEIGLMTQVMDAGADLPRHEQPDRPASYHRKRRPADSRLDLDRPLGEQFDLLRVSDPVRYPAFFDLRGHRYVVRITKGEGEGES
jgi:methionyl-tRNA formyltransferase